MAARTFSKLPKFREVFKKKIEQKLTSWYPGHMYKGMLQMQAKLATVDCVIEVHDARIPLSGRNPQFYTMLTAIRPHILVLNKMDLADLSHKHAIENQLKRERIQNIIFTNCNTSVQNDVNKIVPLAVDLIKESEQVNSIFKSEYKMMIIGVPNVGKSSLINRLRNLHLHKKSATTVGAKAGVTKSVLERIKVSDEPSIYLLDTPGIMQPNIKNLEVGLRLAACSTLVDHLVGEQLIADYVLYWLNKHQNFRYVEYLGIPEPVDDVRLLLFQTCKTLKKTLTVKNTEGSMVVVPNLQAGAQHFIKAFRNGTFGKVMLDDDIIR